MQFIIFILTVVFNAKVLYSKLSSVVCIYNFVYKYNCRSEKIYVVVHLLFFSDCCIYAFFVTYHYENNSFMFIIHKPRP